MTDIPLSHYMITRTQVAFILLAEMISHHTTTIDQAGLSSSGWVQPLASGGIGPSIGGDIPTSHVPQIEPHICMMCG